MTILGLAFFKDIRDEPLLTFRQLAERDKRKRIASFFVFPASWRGTERGLVGL